MTAYGGLPPNTPSDATSEDGDDDEIGKLLVSSQIWVSEISYCRSCRRC